MHSASTGAREPPLFQLARLSASSNRSIWRRKDSSENTPSTTPSDEAGCICPAEPVSLSPSSESSARLGHAAKGKTGFYNGELSARAEGAGHKKVTESSDAAAAAAARDVYRSSASFVSLPEALVLRQGIHGEVGEPEPALPPILAPLEPLHLPPVRRATPPGLPSFESTQRPQPRLCGGGRGGGRGGGGGGGGSTGGGSSLGGLHGFSLSASWSRWRRSRQHGHGRGGRHGNRTSGGPVWRPPASQHSIANHPFLRDMPRAECDVQTGNPAVPQGGCARDRAPGPSAVAMAETEARAGQAARPVTLDDYRFLQSLNGSDLAVAARAVPDEHRDADNGGTTVPSAVLCLKWCVPPCLCPVMSRPTLPGNADANASVS